MPFFERDDVRIHYLEAGDPQGVPVLLIAPGGLRSSIDFWGRIGWNPIEQLSAFRVIAMDQRNAGRSTGPIDPRGWDAYTEDQLALLDHLGVDGFHAVGMCIGGPYLMGLARHAPERLISAVMFQPIGLHDNREAFVDLFEGWKAGLQATHGSTDDATWQAFVDAMFGGDFLFNASREEASACTTRILLLMGDDHYHPQPISRELAELLPNVTFVERWKAPELIEQTDATVKAFLSA